MKKLYNAQTAPLSYGNMAYVDKGEGEVILSVHGIFGGYDQAYDTCKDKVYLLATSARGSVAIRFVLDTYMMLVELIKP